MAAKIQQPPRPMTEAERKEAQLRGELIAPQVRRHTWINIAGPLAAVFLGVFAAAMYLRPIEVLRFMQRTEVAWSGVNENDLALKDGLITYLMSSGYADQDPVVMIHGLGPTAALVWRGVIPPIASAHFKVYAPNLPGFGSSEHKQVDYSIAYQAAAVGQMIDELKLEHVNLIASDIGADVALYYAVDHPEKVERLILVSGGLIGKAGADKLRAGMLPTTPEAVRAQIEESFFKLPPMPEIIYERMVPELAADQPAMIDMLNSVPRDEAHIRGNLGKIFNTLTIIIWGAKNPYFGAAQGESLHNALAGSATVIFKTSGPFPQLEHPDDFAESVIFVMKQTAGGL